MKKLLLGISLLGFSGSAAAKGSDDLKRNMKALELYLQDKEDHKKHCPDLKWNQPKLKVYKSKLKSQLPKKCKKK
jgi:hypothetical protein